MKKTLVKEIPFGKGIARIAVTASTQSVYLDGDYIRDEVILMAKVEVIKDGRVVDEADFADAIEYNDIYCTLYDRAKLDETKTYSRIGRTCYTEGRETADAINAAIEEMKSELAAEFGTKTETEIAKEETIEEANAVVALAESEGIDKLMTSAELAVWRNHYNDLHNEGGEGYIPTKISRERYERALSVLGGATL